MLFSLEAMQAHEGDCLILHVGSRTAPRFVVIDGGPSGTYPDVLGPRLKALRAAKYRNESLPIEYMIVTHVDGDHIEGVLELMQDLRTKDEEGELPYEIMSLWHNSFEGSLGDARGELYAAVGAAAGPGVAPASVSPEAIASAGLPAMAATIAQGRKLYEMARGLDIPLNDEFPGLVMYDPDDSNTVDLGEGAKLTVLGPDEESIDALRGKWKEAIRKAAKTKRRDAVVAASTDRSITNLSSIVLLAEYQGKRMLLTGDAHSDQVLAGLENARCLESTPCKVDILKLPHHGSERNVKPDFFAAVHADHYVVSANGKDGNPDLGTLRMLSAARPDDQFTLHLTNKDGEEGLRQKLQKFFGSERDAGRRYKVKYRTEAARSMKIDLLDKVAY